MTELEIDPLRPADVPAATALSTQAGWNQVAADWHRLLDLAPDGCFAGRIGGELVATGTLVTYDGAVGWIGMILVDEDHRREGYGSAMFDRVRDLAERRGVAVGLDATHAGREVYRRADFVDVAPIERWSGVLLPDRDAPSTGSDARSLDGDAARFPDGDAARPVDASTGVTTIEAGDRRDVEAVSALDRSAVGVDRSPLLDHLLAEDGTTGLVVGPADTAIGDDTDTGSDLDTGGDTDTGDDLDTGDGGVRGYAVVRPGRTHDHVGPLVATSREDVAALLTAAAGVTGDASVLVDLLDVEGCAPLLADLGLRRQRRLTRMASREPDPLLVGDDVVAAAGFELG